MEKATKQMEKWSGDFGKKYTDRNTFTMKQLNQLYMKNYGISARDIFEGMVGKLDRDMRILEVGANSGNMLSLFQEMGFKNIYGIEINSYAVETCKSRTKNINIIQGSALDIPFKDGYFDLVYTAGVLIHISPKDIKQVLGEIYRCSKKYILGIEFFSDAYQQVEYRGEKDLLWKTDFSKLYMDLFDGLKLAKEKHHKYLEGNNMDVMYLLKKK